MGFWAAAAPAIISAVGSIAGGALGNSSSKSANKTQMDLFKNQLQYRVEDAQKAGIHPLYAIGAPTYSPSFVSGNPLGAGLAGSFDAVAGGLKDYNAQQQAQSLANSDYNKTLQEQTLRNNELGIENQMLQNDILRAQLSSLASSSAVNHSRGSVSSGSNNDILYSSPLQGQALSGNQSSLSGLQGSVMLDKKNVANNPMINSEMNNRYDLNVLENGEWNGSLYSVLSFSPAGDYSDTSSENVFDKTSDFFVRHNGFSVPTELSTLIKKLEKGSHRKWFPFFENGEWKVTDNFARARKSKSFFDSVKDGFREFFQYHKLWNDKLNEINKRR